MKVKEAIKYLGHLDPEDSIVISWWEKDMFSQSEKWTDEQWAFLAERVSSKMDWSNAHEEISYCLELWEESL